MPFSAIQPLTILERIPDHSFLQKPLSPANADFLHVSLTLDMYLDFCPHLYYYVCPYLPSRN